MQNASLFTKINVGIEFGNKLGTIWQYAKNVLFLRKNAAVLSELKVGTLIAKIVLGSCLEIQGQFWDQMGNLFLKKNASILTEHHPYYTFCK